MPIPAQICILKFHQKVRFSPNLKSGVLACASLRYDPFTASHRMSFRPLVASVSPAMPYCRIVSFASKLTPPGSAFTCKISSMPSLVSHGKSCRNAYGKTVRRHTAMALPKPCSCRPERCLHSKCNQSVVIMLVFNSVSFCHLIC